MTESEIAVLISRLDSLKESSDKRHEESQKWMEKFDAKISFLQLTMASLPCPARDERHKGISRQIAWIWGIISIILAATVAEYFKR
jgi:hypothetical protein